MRFEVVAVPAPVVSPKHPSARLGQALVQRAPLLVLTPRRLDHEVQELGRARRNLVAAPREHQELALNPVYSAVARRSMRMR